MTKTMLLCGLLLLSIVGCSELSPPSSGLHGLYDASSADLAERGDDEFLAYVHSIVVDTSESKLAAAHAELLAACAADR